MSCKFLPLLFFVFFTSFSNFSAKTDPILIENKTVKTTVSKNVLIYNQLDVGTFELPGFESFNMALEGFLYLKEKGIVKKNILTIVDFSLSSNRKRLWVIDLDKNVVLFETLVAHGRNTGEEFANEFSNQAESFKSSVGFYATGEIYTGKHGLSLKLDGLEKGLNDKARERTVVVHGADYVSESFIKQNKRLGRSLGCPAIPVEMNDKIINVIKDKSCLFIYHPSYHSFISGEITSKLIA